MSTDTTPRLWSIQCILDWLSVREQEGHKFPTDVMELAAEIDHSALLRRLFEGKKPLPTPPPLSASYPWYELMEKGTAVPFEVNVLDHATCADLCSSLGFEAVMIDQAPWRIIKRLSGDTPMDDLLVTYGASQDTFKLWVTDMWIDDLGQEHKQWRLQKM